MRAHLHPSFDYTWLTGRLCCACTGDCGNLGYACNSFSTCTNGACVCLAGAALDGLICVPLETIPTASPQNCNSVMGTISTDASIGAVRVISGPTPYGICEINSLSDRTPYYTFHAGGCYFYISLPDFIRSATGVDRIGHVHVSTKYVH